MNDPVAPSISVIIPVFNSADTLAGLVGRVGMALHGITHEIVLVDDGSADSSWEFIRALCGEYPNVAGLKLACNMGQGAATITGLQHARYPLAVTLDDDLQHMPEHIPQMLKAMTAQTGLVYAGPAAPLKGKGYALLTTLVKIAFAIICRAAFLRHMQTYRLLRLDAYSWHKLAVTRDVTLEGVLATVKPRTVKILVEFRPRGVGISTYTARKLAVLSLNIIRYALCKKLPPGEVAVISETCGLLGQGKIHAIAGK